MSTDDKLADLLGPGLRLVICGTAAGTRSAEVGAYYADPTNRFWPILAKVGLTPRQFQPEEYRSLLDCGIGLTDLVKGEAGTEATLSQHGWNVEGLKERLRQHQPTVVCFNGKRAAKEFFGVREVVYGPHGACHDLDGITFFVAPSTSGQASRYWDEREWHALNELVAKLANDKTRGSSR